MTHAEHEALPNLDEEKLGTRLRAAREYLGLSQAAVAQHLAVPRPAISSMERGHRKVSSLELKKLASLYGRPVSYFLGETEDPILESDEVSNALFRATRALSEGDRVQMLQFAEFLKNSGPSKRSG